MYYRQQEKELVRRISGERRFIQVLSGPRQTGKTTLVHQAAKSAMIPYHYASADIPGIPDSTWVTAAWETARALLQTSSEKVLLMTLRAYFRLHCSAMPSEART